MHGIINIYKPCGMSSNFVLTLLKRNLNLKKLGHLGTLDPLACGVLPVMINKGTKLFDFMLSKTKTYRAIFTFSKETDTLDSEGKIVKVCDKIPNENEILEATKKFIGKISQTPPNFSAKSVNGKRAYQLARSGEIFSLPPKNVEIFKFDLIKRINNNSFLFEIKCSSGTYIRSLARDLGYAVSSCAFMSGLIRISSNEFNILDTILIKDLTNDNISDKIIKFDTLLNSFEKVKLDENLMKQISNGVKINFVHENADNVVVYCGENLIGIGKIENNVLSIKTNLQS